MAQSRARMDEFELYASTAETVGIPYEWLTPRDISDRWPLMRTEDLQGAIYHPTDGYINPADVTQAMAKGARQRGVEITRRAQVDGYTWTGSEWIVAGRMMVERGGNLIPGEEAFEIRAEHVVTATGNHAQRTARLLGIKSPAIPVEHQYIVTEPDPALQAFRKTNPEHPGPARRRCQMVCPRGTRRLDPRPLREETPPPASSSASPTASAPISSRSISTGSKPNTSR